MALAALMPQAGLPAPQQSILPPDAAARPFLEGRDLVEKGRYREAIPKLEEAIQTGHEKPQERFGTSRHAVDFYDPHYWLGRALMELGDEAGALAHLRASESGGRFPERRETDDRARRVAELERREAARRLPPAREPTPPPVPSPTAAPAVPTPETVPPGSTPATASPASTNPTPIPASTAPPPAVSSPSPARLSEALASLAAGDFAEAVTRVRAERRLSPGARELDLVEAAALGGKYVLEGRREAALLANARASLASFRKKGGSSRAEATLLSPFLRALLEPR
jgi:tetratricopeptide (TPR) repeat protein